jgi:hypothetical protein
MSNVVKLPDSMQRSWRVFEGDLRQQLALGGCSRAEIEHTVQTLKPIFLSEAMSRDVVVAGLDPDDAVKVVNAWVRVLVSGLLAQIALREVELFRLRGPSP